MVRSIRISGKYTYILSESAYKSTGCGAESKFGIRIIGERVSAAVEDIAEERVHPNIHIHFNWTLEDDFSFPGGVNFQIERDGSLTIPEGTSDFKWHGGCW